MNDCKSIQSSRHSYEAIDSPLQGLQPSLFRLRHISPIMVVSDTHGLYLRHHSYMCSGVTLVEVIINMTLLLPNFQNQVPFAEYSRRSRSNISVLLNYGIDEVCHS